LDFKQLIKTEEKPHKGLLAAEWVVIAYLIFTLVMMAWLWERLDNPVSMLWGRCRYLVVTIAMWLIYRWKPCRLLFFARVLVQMAFLSWWYPDTYELNKALPNLDHVFASLEQSIFGCQPSLLFSQKVPYGWFSELMCLGYVSYFPLMLVIYLYYFFQRYHEFKLAAFVIMTSFFVYYVIFDLLPVTGPQFYYLAVGPERIAEGIFPNLGDWFLTHSERMAAPGWSDGFWYHILDLTHDAGERPTAAFPSSHVGVTTVLMMMALRTRSCKLTLSMLPFYVLMCFSTVYIYAHYLIDAIAGFITGILLYYALCTIYVKCLQDKKMGLR
jgi:membrane-associated phospholipid phosphatase